MSSDNTLQHNLFTLDIDNQALLMLPAMWIPEGSVVTKKTGEKEYTLKKRIKVYTSGVEKDSPVAIDVQGCFLVDDKGAINQVDSTTVLCWVTTLIEIREFVDKIEMDTF